MGNELFIEKEGKRYARVSSVAGCRKSFDLVPRETLRRKTEIGSYVHEGIKKFFDGQACVFPNKEPEQSYFRGFLKWLQTFEINIHEFERRVFDEELLLTGAFDLIASASFSELPAVFDFKTSAVEDRDVWSVQGYFYQKMIADSWERGEEWTQDWKGVNRDQVFFIRLTPKGDFVPYAYDTDDKVKNRAKERYEQFCSDNKELFNREI
ncbi:MAG: hypothetical protein RR927_05030 [Victivallaceae bacterium]